MSEALAPPALPPAEDLCGELRERLLTTSRPKDGQVLSIRLIEGRDGQYRIVVRVSWRDGEYLVRKRNSSEVKRYKDVSALLERCRETYRFTGAIIVETEKGKVQ